MDPRRLASQLRRPGGHEAAHVAENMNRANETINHRCIDALAIEAGNTVLEIGPGNGAFAGRIVASAPGVHYTGVDWSHAMVAEAEHRNRNLVSNKQARFHQGCAERLPFPTATFDRILSVHTLYFWDPPEQAVSEIRRVMKAGARLCLAFGTRDFMRDLPFTDYGFRLPETDAVCHQLTNAGFTLQAIDDYTETGRSNTGDIVEKRNHILVATA